MTAADWATSLAIDIAVDMHGRPHAEAIELISARLRNIRIDGERNGVAQALGIVFELASADPGVVS